MVATPTRRTGKTERKKAKGPKAKKILRGGLDPTPVDDALVKAATIEAMIEREKEELRLQVVSEYWVDEIAHNRPYSPDTPCKCRKCQNRKHKGWPGPAVMLINQLAWECEWERVLAKPPGKWSPPRDHPEDVTNRWQAIPETEAIRAGLSLVRRRGLQLEDDGTAGEIMVPGCERCEGLRLNGERFCLQCWAALVKENGGDFDVDEGQP
jgi:hypothetical protein